jgi:hypothetical protein
MEARWAHNPEVAGSNPAPAPVRLAQLAEHRFDTAEATGSNPVLDTNGGVDEW